MQILSFPPRTHPSLICISLPPPEMSTAARYTQSMLPGTSQAEIAANTASKKEAPAPELETFQSTLAVQEYIQALISKLQTEPDSARCA